MSISLVTSLPGMSVLKAELKSTKSMNISTNNAGTGDWPPCFILFHHRSPNRLYFKPQPQTKSYTFCILLLFNLIFRLIIFNDFQIIDQTEC